MHILMARHGVYMVYICLYKTEAVGTDAAMTGGSSHHDLSLLLFPRLLAVELRIALLWERGQRAQA